MGRIYAGRNAEALTGYKLVRSQLRGRSDLNSAQLAAIAMYAKAADEPGKASAFKAQAAEYVAQLSPAELSEVNSILSDAGVEGVS